MTDEEIKQFLESHKYSVSASEATMKILNRSYQIIDTIYNEGTHTMTIITPKNSFSFEWILGNGK